MRTTLTEMSVMYDYFSTAEEDDMWKNWGTSDEYLEVLTLRYTMDEELLIGQSGVLCAGPRAPRDAWFPIVMTADQSRCTHVHTAPVW